MEKDDKKYDLTQEEYNRCLIRAEIATFMQGETVDRPVSIFIVGQAGAGKTGLKRFAINEAEGMRKLGRYIELNPDEVAIHHEHYQKIIKEFPNESYKILQRFVSPAMDTYLRPKAVELRNNILQEGTFGAMEGYLTILDFQKNGGNASIGKLNNDGTREKRNVRGGYDIEINILAVDKFESIISCYEREQYFREAGLPPRVVTMENHDRAYINMLETIKAVESRGLFNRIRVFKRGYSPDRPELIYVNGDGKYAGTVDAVTAERARNRKELLSNPEQYIERIERLRERINNNGIKQQLTRLEELEDMFNEEVKKHRDCKSL